MLVVLLVKENMENKRKIAFVCHFSNESVRHHLKLKKRRFRNSLLSLFRHPKQELLDFAIWISDYIKEFEKYNGYDFHIIAPHLGMKKQNESFELNGINYHFVKCDSFFVADFINRKLHLNERLDYKIVRRRYYSLLREINPDIICICGAENPYYSLSALDVKNVPVYLVLQTVVNSPELLAQRDDLSYRKEVERRVFESVEYFGTGIKKYYDLFTKINHRAQCLYVSFPTHHPPVYDVSKEFDFVFYASGLSKNKGIEDTLNAFKIVKDKYPKVTLNIIGGCDEKYWLALEKIMNSIGVMDNIVYNKYYPIQAEMFKQVQKAKAVVVPGITAALNSTVRESLLMGLPTIVYETTATPRINKNKLSVLVAEMENVDNLAAKMIFAYEHPAEMTIMAHNGKEYAEGAFNNKAKVDRLVANIDAIIDNYYKGIPIPEELIFRGQND